MLMRKMMAGAAVLLGAVLAARGLVAAPAPVMDPVVAPYVDGQTLAVARLDVTAVDVAGMEAFATKALAAAGVVDPQILTRVPVMRNMLAKNLDAFKAAGGKQIYAVVEHTDLWPALQPMALLVPVEGGQDKAMMEMVTPWATLAGLQVAELKPGMVFVGSQTALARIKGMKAEARPDLARALERGKGFPLGVAAALTPEARRAIFEIMPQLPPEVGGGSTELVTDAMEGLAIGISGKPGAEIAIQMKTGDESLKMREVLTSALAAFRQSKNVAAALQEGENGKMLGELLDSLKFELPSSTMIINGPTMGAIALPPPPREVVLTLDARQIELMAKMAARGMAEQQVGGTDESMDNVRQLCIGVISHMAEHGGSMPESLEQAAKEKKLAATIMISPVTHSAYQYKVWTADQIKKLDATTTPIVYEQGRVTDARLVVGYLDGHVTRQVTAQELDAQLKAAAARAEAK